MQFHLNSFGKTNNKLNSCRLCMPVPTRNLISVIPEIVETQLITKICSKLFNKYLWNMD